MTTSAAAVFARENARENNGKFGTQAHTEADSIHLSLAVPSDFLDSGPGVAQEHLERFADAGVKGRIEAAPDYEPYNGEIYEGDALKYTSPSGRALYLTNIGEDDFAVYYEDPDGIDDLCFSMEVGEDGDEASTIKDALWNCAVQDAYANTQLGHGMKYFVQDTELVADPAGNLHGTLVIKNEDAGEWTEVTYTFGKDDPLITHDGKNLTGDAHEEKLADILADFNVEHEGDHEAALASYFHRLAGEATLHDDTPAAVAAAYNAAPSL